MRDGISQRHVLPNLIVLTHFDFAVRRDVLSFLECAGHKLTFLEKKLTRLSQYCFKVLRTHIFKTLAEESYRIIQLICAAQSRKILNLQCDDKSSVIFNKNTSGNCVKKFVFIVNKLWLSKLK